MNENTKFPIDNYLSNHRFKLNAESKDTLSKFRDELKKHMSEHPEIVGVTVYGSQLKGRARGENDENGRSDIDSFIFVDEDKCPYLNQKELDKGVADTTGNNYRIVSSGDGAAGKLKKIIQDEFNYDDLGMKDMRVRLISEARINNDLDVLIEHVRKIIAAEKSVDESDSYPDLNDRVFDAAELGKLFHLQLGRGLDVYRKKILDKLKSLGDIGDKIWKDYILEQITFESGNITPSISDLNLQNKKNEREEYIEQTTEFHNRRDQIYPKTVQKAIEYFNL